MLRPLCIFTFCFLAFSNQSVSQNFTFTLDTTVTPIENGDYYVAKIGEVSNPDTSTIELLWKRTEHYLPSGWFSSVGDRDITYVPWIDEQPLTLEGGGTSPLQVDIYTEGLPGDSAIVELCVQLISDSTNSQCRTYAFVRERLSRTNTPTPRPSDISISPNPTARFFEVQTEYPIQEARIYNTSGQFLRTISLENNLVGDLKHFSDGMYFVAFVGENGKIISTKKIQLQE